LISPLEAALPRLGGAGVGGLGSAACRGGAGIRPAANRGGRRRGFKGWRRSGAPPATGSGGINSARCVDARDDGGLLREDP
jgi:hypothetical protein